MNETKIIIKNKDVKLKTTDVELAIRTLEKINDNSTGGKILKMLFTGNIPTDEVKEVKKDKVEKPYHPKKRRYNVKANKNLKLDIKEGVAAKKERKKGFLSTWSEEEDMTVINSIKAGLSNTEIASNPFLLKTHTDKSIMTRASGIRNLDSIRTNKKTIKLAKEILK